MKQWIPKSEEPPVVGEHVLAYEAGDIGRMQVLAFDGEHYLGVQDGLDYSVYVTHWMPLPLPPESDTDTPSR